MPPSILVVHENTNTTKVTYPEIVLSSPVGVRIREELITVMFPDASSCASVKKSCATWCGEHVARENSKTLTHRRAVGSTRLLRS